LSGRSPYAPALDALLSRGEVSGHDFVYGELLIGDKGAPDPRLGVVAEDLGIAYDRQT
jgi:hypothetical protein